MASSIVEGFSLTHAQILDGSQTFLEAALATSVGEELDVYGVNDGSLSPNTDQYENEGDDAVLSTWSWLNFAEIAVQAGYLSFPLIANLTGQEVEDISATAAVDEVQTITVTATGGTFTITVGGQTTSALAFNASNGTVQTALEALSTVDTGDITVSGSAGSYVLTFGADYAGKDVSMVTLGTGSLTGGTATVAQTTKGEAAGAAAYGLDLWHEDSMNTQPRPMILKMPSKDHAGIVRTLTFGLYKVQFQPITFDGPKYKDGLKVNYNGRALLSPVDEKGAAHADGKKKVGRLLSHA